MQQNMRLYELLERTFAGQLILYNHAKEQCISSDRLGQIVVDELMLRTLNGSLPLVPALTYELFFFLERKNIFGNTLTIYK